MRMVDAHETLRESVSPTISIRTLSVHDDISSSESPCPSLPTKKTSSARSSNLPRHFEFSPSAAAKTRLPSLRRSLTVSAMSADILTLIRNMPPIEARTVFGDRTSAQTEITTVSNPVAAAVRIMVPRFPGSRTPSHMKILSSVPSSKGLQKPEESRTAIIPCGDFSVEIFPNGEDERMITSAPLRRASPQSSENFSVSLSSTSRYLGHAPHPSASLVSFSPSQRKSPSERRNFGSDSFARRTTN